MYLSFFGLEQPPFQALPSPAYYVNFAAAEDTALSILFSITAGKGVIKVTGESGTGKTVMVTHIEEQLPINYRKVTIHSPCLNAETCLKQLCHEIGISVSERDTELRLIAKLHQTFLQEFTSGYRTIIFVDDAHLFQPEVLKTLCLLSYLKTRGDQQGDKLVQVVLLGTPALDEKLETPSIEDWGQRINRHIEMPRLDEVEVMHYTNHRMKVAGYSKEPVFDLKAARKIQRLTSGVPEVINRLADQLLVTAYKCGDTHIKPRHFRKIASIYQDKMHFEFPKAKILFLMTSLTFGAVLAWKPANSSLLTTTQAQHRTPLSIFSLGDQKAKRFIRSVSSDKPVLVLRASSAKHLNQGVLVLKQLLAKEQDESIYVLSNANIKSEKLHQLIFCDLSRLSSEDRAQLIFSVKKKLTWGRPEVEPISTLVFQAKEQGLI